MYGLPAYFVTLSDFGKFEIDARTNVLPSGHSRSLLARKLNSGKLKKRHSDRQRYSGAAAIETTFSSWDLPLVEEKYECLVFFGRGLYPTYERKAPSG